MSRGRDLLAPVMAVDAWLHRHARLVGTIGAIWFALTCADYAGFIHLPRLLVIPASLGVVLAFLRYGVWEAFVTPEVEARRRREAGQ